MKRLFVTVGFLSLILSAAPAQATEVGSGRNFGIGFSAPNPASIVGKLFLSQSTAIDFGLGFWSYGKRWCRDKGPYRDCDGFHAFTFNLDYLWQENLARGTAKLDWHLGIGGRI